MEFDSARVLNCVNTPYKSTVAFCTRSMWNFTVQPIITTKLIAFYMSNEIKHLNFGGKSIVYIQTAALLSTV